MSVVLEVCLVTVCLLSGVLFLLSVGMLLSASKC